MANWLVPSSINHYGFAETTRPASYMESFATDTVATEQLFINGTSDCTYAVWSELRTRPSRRWRPGGFSFTRSRLRPWSCHWPLMTTSLSADRERTIFCQTSCSAWFRNNQFVAYNASTDISVCSGPRYGESSLQLNLLMDEWLGSGTSSLSSRTVPSELFDHFTLLLHRWGIRELAASL